jgi:hypothetical protein
LSDGDKHKAWEKVVAEIEKGLLEFQVPPKTEQALPIVSSAHCNVDIRSSFSSPLP